MRSFTLISAKVRDNALMAIRCAPVGWQVTLKEPKRNLNQNAAFWSLMDDVSQTCEFAGERRSKEDWRTIFLSGWAKATGRNVDVVKGIEGEPVALGISSASLSKSEMSDVLEYVNAWAANQCVKRRETEAA